MISSYEMLQLLMQRSTANSFKIENPSEIIKLFTNFFAPPTFAPTWRKCFSIENQI